MKDAPVERWDAGPWSASLYVLVSAHGPRNQQHRHSFTRRKTRTQACARFEHGSSSRLHPVQ